MVLETAVLGNYFRCPHAGDVSGDGTGDPAVADSGNRPGGLDDPRPAQVNGEKGRFQNGTK